MANGVFNQRLQQQRRQSGTAGSRVQAPADLQTLTKADLFNGQVALGQRDLLPQRDGLRRVRQRTAKQLAQVFQHGLGLERLGAH